MRVNRMSQRTIRQSVPKRRPADQGQQSRFRSKTVCAALVASALLCACGSSKVVCPAIAGFGIALTVVDSVTGAAPATGSSVVVTYVGSSTDTLKNATTANEYSIPGGGPIDLRVITAGYRDWVESGINVAVNSCNIPQTIQVTAKLQR